VGYGTGSLLRLTACNYFEHARLPYRPARVDAGDPSVRVRAAQHGGMDRTWQVHVVHVARPAGRKQISVQLFLA